MSMPENPQIQQLLAALPEMFPGVQKIPLANIRLNPNNPGAKAAEEDIAELAANIALVGLKNAAKVMPDPAGPLSPGVTLHPDNPRLKGDGTPWSLSDFRFLNLSGELRQLACQRLQWTEIDGYVLNPTPEQAVEITDLDNDVRQKGWWAKYQSVEALIKANPTLKQREIGTRLRIDKERVNWALRLLPLLNTEARGVLVRNPYKSSKGNMGISESAASHLADLGPGSAFKPGGTPNDPAQAAGSSLDPAQANLGPRLVASAQLLYPYPAIPPETQDLVYRTLAVACKHQMKEAQVQKLVEWVQAGNPPETFGSAPHTPTKAKKAPALTPEVTDKLIGFGKQLGAAEARGEDTKPIEEQITAYLAELKTNPAPGVPTLSYKVTSPEGFALLRQAVEKLKAWFKPGPDAGLSPTGDGNINGLSAGGDKPHAPEPVASGADKVFWETVVGISFIKQLKKKAAKGEPLTRTEKAFALLYRFYESFLKPAGKLFKKGFLFLWDKWRNLGGKKSRWFFDIVGALLIACAAIKIVHTVLIPVHWIENKVERAFHHEVIAPSVLTPIPTVVPAPQPAVSNIPQKVEVAENHLIRAKKTEAPAPVTTPVSIYQPSVAFNTPASSADSSGVTTLYDPKLLEQEIKAVRDKSRITAFAVLPDDGMPGDLAVSRTQAATDPDKYTLIVDGDKKKILNLATNTTNLVINFKSTDPFNILGSGGGVTVFYEDVLYIHTDEIDVETKIPSRYFQLTLVGAGAKNALTFQCDSAEDLSHLVSGLEYFIRNSRLGRDTALAGMPYLTQGLRLNNDCVVEKLWAESPADKAGLRLGDMVWSLENNAYYPPDRKKLEAALRALTPGPHTLFVASAADRDKSQSDVSFGRVSSFNPKRRKVVLTVP